MNEKKTTLEQVIEWHEAFGVEVKDSPDISNKSLNGLRMKLLTEELFELNEALFVDESIEKTLDALIDLQYILDGTFATLGFHKLKEAGFREVQRSNMSKMGEDGRPIYRSDGKVLKGPNFFEPNLSAVINDIHPEVSLRDEMERKLEQLRSEGGTLSAMEGLVNISDVDLLSCWMDQGEPVVEFIYNEQAHVSRIFKGS